MKTALYSLFPAIITLALLFLPISEAISQERSIDISERRIAYGLDILVSDSGIGLGGFYRLQFTPRISGFINLSIAEAKDEREIELYDWWTGQKVIPGKINRFLVIPAYLGIQYRLFKDKILDNFRPYVTAAVGPSMIYATPYERDFFSALGHGKAYHTLGGYIGFGANFGSDSSNLVGINFRYYFVPYFSGIRSMLDGESTEDNIKYVDKTQFGGFFITFTFGTMR